MSERRVYEIIHLKDVNRLLKMTVETNCTSAWHLDGGQLFWLKILLLFTKQRLVLKV